jgi:hypothetical protein
VRRSRREAWSTSDPIADARKKAAIPMVMGAHLETIVRSMHFSDATGMPAVSRAVFSMGLATAAATARHPFAPKAARPLPS